MLSGRRRDLVARQNPLLEPEELLLDPSGSLIGDGGPARRRRFRCLSGWSRKDLGSGHGTT
ncbi:hypothetical protein SSCG_02246 [Streptomyces clavuligerus]|nr:hypothetical protein SSCG_02246 [Streptomyces clavuligerus]